jgi:PKD repeat protein
VAGPTARIALTPGTGNAPLTVTADASASTAGGNPIGTYSINFGDGTTASAARATHTFTQAGDYTVTVTVTDSAGRRSTATAAARVTTAAAVGPTAQLAARGSQAQAPADLIADASASTAGSTPITAYTFTFSDGTTVGPQASPTARHQVTAAGTYTVNVTVRDQAGRTSTANASVQLTAPATTPPRAALIAERPPAGGVAAASLLRLNASGSVPGSSPITSYRFDFGDGTVEGPKADPTSAYHNYLAGTYQASVTVTDRNGKQATATTTVNRVGTVSLSKRVVSSSPGGTTWQVGIGNQGSTILVQSISGSGVHDTCSGTKIGTENACTFTVDVPSGSASWVVTVRTTAQNSPTSIDLAR